MAENKRREILPVVLGAATACIILAAAAILFMDTAIRIFAPGIYTGGRLVNTYNELKTEKTDMDSFFSQGVMISDNMTVELKGTLDNAVFDFSGGYNRGAQKLYLEGNAGLYGKTYDLQLFSEDGVTGVCLPEYADAWFCRENKTSVPYIAAALENKKNSSVLNKVYPVLQELTKEINISGYSKKNNGISEYRVYMSGEAVKKALSEIASAVTEDSRLKNIDAALSGSGGLVISDILKEYFNSLEFPETIAFSVYERNKCIVYLSGAFNMPDGNIKLWVDMSEKARLRDSVDGGIIFNSDGSEYGFSYKSSGNHFFRNENLSDETEIEISLPLLDKTLIKTKTEFKNPQNFEFSLNASNEKLFTAEISAAGACADGKLTANADKIYINYGSVSHSGSGSIALSESEEEFTIPEKERYGMEDMPVGKLIEMFIENF